MTKVKFILSSISIGLLFWSINHTLIYGIPELYVFKNIRFVSDVSNNWQNGLFGKMYTNSWIFVDNHC